MYRHIHVWLNSEEWISGLQDGGMRHMTKEVMLAISGLQSDLQEGRSDRIETVTAAEYYRKNGRHYVLYEEMAEEDAQPTKSLLKFDAHMLELTRHGVINTRMVFEENKKNLTSYNTPFGQMVIGIDTKQIRLQEQEDFLRMDVEYALDVNEEYLADSRIKITIRPNKVDKSTSAS